MKNKKVKKIVSIILVIVVFCSAFIPTKKYELKPNAVTKKEVKVVVIGGTSRAIIAKSKNRTIYTYRSSNSKIATVSKNGVVTGKKKGKVSIIRYITKNKRTQIDKVLDYKVEKFAIKSKKTLYMNGSYLLVTNASKASFKSSNKKVATVTKQGKVKPVKTGKVTITATNGKLKTKKTFQIKKDALKKITAQYSGASLYQGQKIDHRELTVKALYKSGLEKKITDYTLSKEQFENAGAQKITVQYKKKTAKCSVMVTEKKVSSIQAGYTGGSLAVGQTVPLKDISVTVVYNDGTTRIASENELALSNATAKEKGVLPLIVSHVPSGAQTRVNIPINGLKIMGVDSHYSEKVIYTEDGVDASKIKVMVTYEDGTTALLDSSAIRIGSTTTEDGKVKIVLYYTVDGVEYSTILSVEERSKKLCGLVVEAVTDNIYIGKDLNRDNYVVKAVYSDGTEKVVTDWTTDYLPAEVEGNANVQFQYSEDGITVTTNQDFMVKKPVVTGIKVVDAPGTVKEGTEIDNSKIQVQLQYEDGGSEAISGFQTNYNAADTTPGSRQIVVQYQEYSDSFMIEVLQKRVTELVVTPPTMQTIMGQEMNTTGMSVTAQYDNGTSGVVDGWATNYSAGLPAGKHTLVISYDGAEATFPMEVVPALEVQQTSSSEIVKHPVTISTNQGGVNFNLVAGSASVSKNSETSCVVTPVAPGELLLNVERPATGEVKQVAISVSAFKMSYQNLNGGNVALGDNLVFTTNAPSIFTYSMKTTDGKTNAGTATPNSQSYTHVARNMGELTITARDLVSGEVATKTLNVRKELAISGKSTVKVKKTITLRTTKQQVVWSSSDNSIATVNSKGVVTGKKAGSVKIQATFPEYGNRVVKKTITVTK